MWVGKRLNFKIEIAQTLARVLEEDRRDIIELLEVPPNTSLGDYAFPCFRLAKKIKKAPAAIAQELSTMEKPWGVQKIVSTGPYLNFFLDRQVLAKEVLEDIAQKEDKFGASMEGAGKTVCMDYSSINIAKPFHIGHLSSTVIGASLSKIYNFLGYKSISINHLGDWGTQFGKLIVAYKLWGSKEEIQKNSVDALMKIYVRFHDEAEKNPVLEDEARAWFKRIEQGDPEALSLMEWFKELTLKEAEKIYNELNIKFDSYAGESFYNDKMQPVIDELEEKRLLKDSEGAKVVDLEAYGMPPCLIVKSDGTTLYATRDIAAAFYRKKTYDFYKALYIVAYQQNLHFKQWFKVVELMGCEWAKDLEHVAFGMVSMEDGTLSTRKGKVVLLRDVLEQVRTRCLDIIKEKSPSLENKEQIAKQVGYGAVVFDVLLNNRIKDITFSFDRVLNFDGETGPYVQYTHARCCSVLRRASGGVCEADFSALENEEAFAVLTLLHAFPDAVREACRRNEPSIITRHIVDLAQAFNRFYYEHRILQEDQEKETCARLMLTDSVRQVLKTGLSLLNIAAPQQM